MSQTEVMCLSLLRSPQFTAEFRRCRRQGRLLVPGKQLMTETDVAIEIARLGPSPTLEWQRLHTTPVFIATQLHHDIHTVQTLDVTEVLAAEKETLLVQKTQKMFERTVERSKLPPRQRRAALVFKHLNRARVRAAVDAADAGEAGDEVADESASRS